MSFTDDEKYIYLAMDFMELLRLGYSPRLLITAWGRAASDLRTYEIGEVALKYLRIIVAHDKRTVGRIPAAAAAATAAGAAVAHNKRTVGRIPAAAAATVWATLGMAASATPS